MDFTGAMRQLDTDYTGADLRAAPRYASLIRSAKLITAEGEFICVIRDASATGVGLRAFHRLPAEPECELELRNGLRYRMTRVRQDGFESSYRFPEPIWVDELISEHWRFPARQLRLSFEVPLVLATLAGRFAATSDNLSQQGARLRCDALLAIDQKLRIEAGTLPEIRAKVRWRRETTYGLVFDDTFSLRDFALLAAAVQAPGLVTAV